MNKIDHIRIPVELFKIEVRSLPKVCILALAYNFGINGLRLSNDQLARLFSVHKRTVEKAISELRKDDFVRDIGTNRNDRCLVVTGKTTGHTTGQTAGTATAKRCISTGQYTGRVPAKRCATTGLTADHKERKERVKEEEGGVDSFSGSAFVDYWNSKNNIPNIKTFTTHRQEKLQAQMAESSFADNWQLIIDKLSASSFATGHNKRNWKADIDWLLKNSDNYTKVLEGKYDNSPQVAASSQKPFTPQQEHAFLDANTHKPTESEAESLLKSVGLL